LAQNLISHRIPYTTGGDTEKEVELRFELNLTYEIRVKILKQLIMTNENQRAKVFPFFCLTS